MKLGPIQEEWIEALESGEYKQNTKGVLRTVHDTYCCLGVACDIYDPSGWDSGKIRDFPYLYSDHEEGVSSSAFIPVTLVDHYGLRSDLGMALTRRSLAELNDDGVPFSEIAATLREHPDEYFSERR